MAESVYSLAEIAALVGAEVPDGAALSLKGALPLREAGPRDISFLENPAYVEEAKISQAGVILTRQPFSPSQSIQLIVREPRKAFFLCLQLLHREATKPSGIDPSVILEPGVHCGADVSIGPLSVVGRGARIGDRSRIGAGVLLGSGVEIGAECKIHPGAVLLDGVRLGKRVVVGSRTVLGSDGYGYLSENGKHSRIQHHGTVILEDDVEIGAGCCVDRAVSGATLVESGTKIDNLVHIGHNVRIGRDCLIVAQVGISGSVRVGDGCTLAGKVGVAGHLEIGAGAVVAAASRIVRSVPAGATVAGWPAVEVGLWRKTVALTKRLPLMWERLVRLENSQGIQRPAGKLDEDSSHSDR